MDPTDDMTPRPADRVIGWWDINAGRMDIKHILRWNAMGQIPRDSYSSRELPP